MNIFVANLSYRTSADELRTVFENFGEVEEVKIITDKNTGQSRGFGFVEMSDDQNGKSAISGLNGTELFGRAVIVKEAEPRESRPARKPFGNNGGGGNFRRREY